MPARLPSAMATSPSLAGCRARWPRRRLWNHQMRRDVSNQLLLRTRSRRRWNRVWTLEQFRRGHLPGSKTSGARRVQALGPRPQHQRRGDGGAWWRWITHQVGRWRSLEAARSRKRRAVRRVGSELQVGKGGATSPRRVGGREARRARRRGGPHQA